MALLFARNAEALMGTVDDPPDGGVVARTCLGAVAVYAVFSFTLIRLTNRSSLRFADVKSSCIDASEQFNYDEHYKRTMIQGIRR